MEATTGKPYARGRSIGRLWETTQMRIAFTVVGGGFVTQNIVVASIIFNLLKSGHITAEMLTLLVTVLGTMGSTMSLIIGFYFSRANQKDAPERPGIE